MRSEDVVTVLNATNGKPGEGASFDFSDALGTLGLLAPGAVSGAVEFRLRVATPAASGLRWRMVVSARVGRGVNEIHLGSGRIGSPAASPTTSRTRSKWVNGTVLHYCFFGGGSRFSVPKVQADAVRDAFAKWKAIGIGLEFKEVNQLSEAEVRIGYSTADGVRPQPSAATCSSIPLNEPTTVYGWSLTTPYGRGTALHELGHVFGMEHEHQNPYAGIKWHEQAVYDALAQPPNNWDRDTTYHNILKKLTPQQVQGSTWDPDSIMEYEFEPGLIDEPEEYDINGLTPPGTLSAPTRNGRPSGIRR